MANNKKAGALALSRDEAAKNGQKGGYASGEARRKKKAMREMAGMVLAAPVPASKAKLSELIKMGFEADDVNVQLLSLLAVGKNAAKGDIAALTFLRDTAGEKPTGKVDVNQTVTGNFVLEIVGEDDASNSGQADDST